MGIRHGGTQLDVRIRLNHVISNQRGDYSTVVIEDAASGLQIIEVELTPKQLYDMIANRGSGMEGVPAVMPTQEAMTWFGQQSWHFSRKLGWEWKADDPAVKAWAARLREELGLHTSSVTDHNDGSRASWTVYSNSITGDSYAQYAAMIEAADLPPKSRR